MDKHAGCAIGTVARLTGLTEHTIRAWERRYGVVSPLRSAGGTRRYGEADVAKLRLLAAAVERGHRIKTLAGLGMPELRSLSEPTPSNTLESLSAPLESTINHGAITTIFEAGRNLDTIQLNRLLTEQFEALGEPLFAERVALPVLRLVGDGWMRGELSIAVEHLVSAHLRRLLGNALTMANTHPDGLRVLFTTPEGEPHEFGALVAAIIAADAGAAVTYVGPDSPAEMVSDAARKIEVEVVAISVVNLDQGSQRRYLNRLRAGLSPDTQIWVGGQTALREPEFQYLPDLETLRRAVAAALPRQRIASP